MSSSTRLGLGHPDGADLRAAEHRVRGRSSVEWLQIVGMKQVVTNVFCLAVGHVLQLVAPVHVTQCPHARAEVCPYSSTITSPIGPILMPAALAASIWSPLGLPSGRDQQRVALHRRVARLRWSPAARCPRPSCRSACDRGAQAAARTAQRQARCSACEMSWSSAREQLVTAVDDGDTRAERPEDVTQLGGDESATEHHEMLGLMGDSHDRVAGVVRAPRRCHECSG